MIRLFEYDDISHVMEIERASFSDPWSFWVFADDICLDFSYDIVYEENGEILAYLLCWMNIDEAHLINIAVREDMRGKGIGKKLLINAFEEAKKRGIERSLLEVRVSNQSAIHLYESLGYKIIYTIKKFYEDNGENAYLMEKIF